MAESRGKGGAGKSTGGKGTGGKGAAAKRAAAPADPPEVRDAGTRVNPATAEKAAAKRAASPAKPRAAGPDAPRKGNGGSYAESAKKRRAAKETDHLLDDLRAFAAARPSGWGHDDWLVFLDALKERGHDTSEPEAIGRQLERERLAVVLSELPGLGPKRVDALVERFETLWSARHAGVDEVASVPGIPRSLAERVVEHLRGR